MVDRLTYFGFIKESNSKSINIKKTEIFYLVKEFNKLSVLAKVRNFIVAKMLLFSAINTCLLGLERQT